ncbi:WXG100 family type VII secretion target [Kibdelosporangium phytohabitans]|uniref:ESAT-6-like protein n=1 Tax=Kibdelosporangium phytohabitans TaxID=860235 RepID=A0A0N9HT06_9PSEU|nr:hypothetical protein [Kibdelosporangium phytohabitans]ALG10360.1 hypothetical protein AOZ06_28795 [Kibdelosporangium phytohabitans]MBE1461408.1 uncharacterized protein YukE [Kibdelosporangium phytohabitans]
MVSRDDTITYDYTTLEYCVEEMRKAAQWIVEQTDAMQADVKKILVGWTGDTADAYDRLCDDLEGDLTVNANDLTSLEKKMEDVIHKFQLQDKNSARSFGDY